MPGLTHDYNSAQCTEQSKVAISPTIISFSEANRIMPNFIQHLLLAHAVGLTAPECAAYAVTQCNSEKSAPGETAPSISHPLEFTQS